MTLLHAVSDFSQRERDVEECHRRLGRVGPEHQSSRRGRGEQCRPLRRRVGTVGACPPPLRGRSAAVARNAAVYLFRQTIELYVDFYLTGAWRHHISMRPSSRSQSAATTALRKVHGELSVVDFGALASPYRDQLALARTVWLWGLAPCICSRALLV